MNIHWIANCVVPPPKSLSGGDRIMVECFRRWKDRHAIHLYGWEGTRQLCEHQNLDGIHHILWPCQTYEKLGKVGHFGAQILTGLRHARHTFIKRDRRETLLVSSSDMLPDSLTALQIKRQHHWIPWVAAFYLFAPSMWDLLSGKPGAGWLFSMYAPFQRWILKSILREADLILVTGDEDRERMIRLGRKPDSVFVVRGGVDLSLPRQVPEGDEKIYDAVFIGRFHPQKGCLELMHIWKDVVQQHPKAQLLMIGTGPLDRKLKEKCRLLGLERSVVFKGFVDGIEKYHLIKQSRLIVHPAIYDSGGMAAAEGLVCGLPGVSFDLPSLRSYYPKGFLKAQEGDRVGFSKNIIRLLREPLLASQMREEAFLAGKDWDWDLRASKLMEEFQRLIRLC